MGKDKESKRTPGGYPTAKAALAAMQQADIPGDQDVDRLIVRFLASGEVAYRFFINGEDEYEGGVISV